MQCLVESIGVFPHFCLLDEIAAYREVSSCWTAWNSSRMLKSISDKPQRQLNSKLGTTFTPFWHFVNKTIDWLRQSRFIWQILTIQFSAIKLICTTLQHYCNRYTKSVNDENFTDTDQIQIWPISGRLQIYRYDRLDSNCVVLFCWTLPKIELQYYNVLELCTGLDQLTRL
jgi:hypothetical protein